ncbi:flagellar motor switch protein FliG [Carboxydothermus ferrireducens]|uniref:Flagellar motor switch protein FliG n=1 Tax=Carboxydothermus ferrireducens DSM 11255 TaxID=1119529 RepID=A0ABX2R6W1_9THEO|nr:flagellar motor switch protein FliG [Carboxydothermus ferrireducens]NYE56897.1 flagellar motor switch protein FliG [Carboxydothermus ferrireducens DSM 11255]
MAREETRKKNINKIAKLLIALGPEHSAKILAKHFTEEEIEKISMAVATIGQITPEERQKVVEEFLELYQAQEYISTGGVSYAKEMLEKALGPQKANEIIKKLISLTAKMPFQMLRKADARQLINFIQNEHPQTIALILSYLLPEQAAMILSSMPAEMQSDIIKRIATMERTSPEVIREIEEVLEKKVSSVFEQNYTRAGGIEAVVEILNRVDRSTEKNILENLEQENQELAEEIRKRMFVFEDIVTLDDMAIQRVLREVESRDLAFALKGSTEEVKQRIMKNLSKRAAEMLNDELAYMGPVRLKDVEQAQQKIVAIIRRLEEAGEIIISRGGEDALVF